MQSTLIVIEELSYEWKSAGEKFMIIDVHSHLSAPDAFYGFRTLMQVSGNLMRNPKPFVRDEEIVEVVEYAVELMDAVGTDLKFLSPPPFTLWHSHPRVQEVQTWVKANNDLVARAVKLYPTRFRGIAGLPQVAGQPVEIVFDEFDLAPV